MTETEKLITRQAALQSAIASVKTGLSVERKLSADKPSGHWTTALSELKAIEEQLRKLQLRYSV